MNEEAAIAQSPQPTQPQRIKTVALREEDYDRLRRLAEEQGRTISGQVNYMVKREMKSDGAGRDYDHNAE